MNDQLLIEQAYSKIYENKSILIPRRSREEREKNYQIALQKPVKEYIKNGGIGNLYLFNTPINSLPKGLKVSGDLHLENTNITTLPEGLTVGGGLFLKGLNITSLPQTLSVGEYLDLRNTPISKQYTKKQLKQMLPNVKGEIYK